MGVDGAGTRIGVCDGPVKFAETGISLDSACRFDLRANFQPFRDETEKRESARHASAITRIICGSSGVASRASLCYAEALEYGWVILRVLRAIDWLLDQDIDVLLLPLGVHPPTPVFREQLLRAAKKNVLVVVSVGNCGPGKFTSPADGPFVLSAGALDELGGQASYSGTGWGEDGRRIPDVLAPGFCSEGLSGVSVAAAWVAGLAALLAGAFPDRKKTMVRDAIARSGPDGRISPRRAWDILANPDSAIEEDQKSAHSQSSWIDPRFAILAQAGGLTAPVILCARGSTAEDRWESLRSAAIATGWTGQIESADSTGSGLIVADPKDLISLAHDPSIAWVQLAQLELVWLPHGPG